MNLKEIWQVGKFRIGVGAIMSAVAAVTMVTMFLGWRWGVVAMIPGAILGAILGAISGLDNLLPQGKATSSQRGNKTPFGTAALLLGVAIVLLIAPLYTRGRTEFSCQRLEQGQLSCQQSSHIWLGSDKDKEYNYEQVLGADQFNQEQIFLNLDAEEGEDIYNVAPDTAQKITQFSDSTEKTLLIQHDYLWFIPAALFCGGIIALLMAIVKFRTAYKELSQQFEQ